MKKPALN